jgi:hypothetical protein
LVTNGLIWVFLVRPERDPNETYKRPKGDLLTTSVVVATDLQMLCILLLLSPLWLLLSTYNSG